MTQQTQVPLFALSSTVTIDFTIKQLVAIALSSLSESGHVFAEADVNSEFTAKGGLKLTIETGSAKPAPKRRRAANKPAAIAAPVTEAVVPVEVPGTTAFQASASTAAAAALSMEDTIANVKEEAGVSPLAAFSTESANIVASDTGVASANFDFKEVNDFQEVSV